MDNFKLHDKSVLLLGYILFLFFFENHALNESIEWILKCRRHHSIVSALIGSLQLVYFSFVMLPLVEAFDCYVPMWCSSAMMPFPDKWFNKKKKNIFVCWFVMVIYNKDRLTSHKNIRVLTLLIVLSNNTRVRLHFTHCHVIGFHIWCWCWLNELNTRAVLYQFWTKLIFCWSVNCCAGLSPNKLLWKYATEYIRSDRCACFFYFWIKREPKKQSY